MTEVYGVTAIASRDLCLDDVPDDSADWGVIGRFALTFDGYSHWATAEQCGTIANETAERFREDGVLPTEVDTLRACLFFEQRRWRHFGWDPDEPTMRYIGAILAATRELIARREALEFAGNAPEGVV